MKRERRPKRPSDKLSPEEQREKWEAYLDAHVGRNGARPKWEILIDPLKLQAVTPQGEASERTAMTERSDIFREALPLVIDRLPLFQRKVVKLFYGIGVPDGGITQTEIAERLGISQKGVRRRLASAKRHLKKLVRAEVSRLVHRSLRDKS